MVTTRSTQIREQIGMWSESLVRQTKEHPGRTVAIALGAGYLLGGGLFSRLTFRILGAGVRIGLRMGLVPLMTQSIVGLGTDLLMRTSSARDDEQGDDGPSGPHSEAKSDQSHPDKKET